LYKLAQLLTSDILHIRELKESIKVYYKISQVMSGLGIIEYSDKLAYIIDRLYLESRVKQEHIIKRYYLTRNINY
jgi:hypothetical protein